MTDDLDLELKRLVQASPLIESALPDPGIILWKAEIERRRQVQAEALRPIVLFQRVALVAVLVTVAVFFLLGSMTNRLSEGVWLQLLAVLVCFLAASFWSYRTASASL
jgi:hypothetical protein